MSVPSIKTIAGMVVSVDSQGWPYWTRLTVENGRHSWCLNEEEAHDMLYAFQRICEYLDDSKKRDQE